MASKYRSRTIYWTEYAKIDLRWMHITRNEWRIIRDELLRLSEVSDLRKDSRVCPVRVTNGKWLRLKITQPDQIRVFFSGSDHLITVQEIMRRRQNTYPMLRNLYLSRKGNR